MIRRSETERQLRARFAGELRRRAREITRDWVEAVSERLEVDRRNVLPTDQLLDDIPVCLEAIADYAEAPECGFPDDLLRDRMDALVRLRRGQGFGVAELLEEYDLLAAHLQAFIEDTVATADVAGEPASLAAVVGGLKDAFARFGIETARSYRVWSSRERRRRALRTTTFATMVRHELRNRLGSAQTAAELLCEPGLTPERRKRLGKLIQRGLEQALETIDVVKSILADEGMDSATLTGSWIRLDELVADVGGSIEEDGPRVEVELCVEGDVEVPDPRVGMVLLNLVDNAVKYHRPRGDDRWIRLVAEPDEQTNDGARIRFTVQDNGPGIAKPDQRTAFEFTTRGEGSGAPGSGLGLAMSRDIVRQMGGEMRLESTPGEGTRVSFVAPARRNALPTASGDEKMDTGERMR